MSKIILTVVFIAISWFSFPINGECKTKYEVIQEEYNVLFEDLEVIEDEYLEEWFLSYKELADTYSYYIERETVYDFFSEEEIQYMCQVIETETYQAEFIQKVNVANVLLNRFSEYETFGYLDMIEVVTHEKQFEYFRTDISEDTINALEFAFEIKDTTSGSVGFRSDKKTDTFNGWVYSFYDGAHWFYKLEEK